jgi:hypothetical protein
MNQKLNLLKTQMKNNAHDVVYLSQLWKIICAGIQIVQCMVEDSDADKGRNVKVR